MPVHSASRSPVSRKTRNMAMSRLASKALPSHAFSSLRMSASGTSGTRGGSTLGGCILAMGWSDISSCSTAPLQEDVERHVAQGGGATGGVLQLVDHEGFQLVPGDVGDGVYAVVVGQELCGYGDGALVGVDSGGSCWRL